MNNQSVTDKERYEEACKAALHYSNSILSVRTLTIAQGLVVLGSSSNLSKEGEFIFSIAVSIFGIFLTMILFYFQKGYWTHFNCFVDYIVKYNEAPKKNSKQPKKKTLSPAMIESGPWTTFLLTREEDFHSGLKKHLRINGTFILIGVSLAILLLYDTTRLIIFP